VRWRQRRVASAASGGGLRRAGVMVHPLALNIRCIVHSANLRDAGRLWWKEERRSLPLLVGGAWRRWRASEIMPSANVISWRKCQWLKCIDNGSETIPLSNKRYIKNGSINMSIRNRMKEERYQAKRACAKSGQNGRVVAQQKVGQHGR